MVQEDKIAKKIEEGIQEEEGGSDKIYSEEGRQDLVENDEIEPWEEGFMEGAEGDAQDAKCKECGKALLKKSEVVEKRIGEEVCFFCSDKCLHSYEKQLQEG